MSQIESIGAIQDCMKALGFKASEAHSFQVEAKITNNLKPTSQGMIEVTFNSNWHSGDGPYLQADFVIKSYGIPYEEFKPRWQLFSFDSSSRTLTVKGDGYDFDLQF